MTRQRLLNRPTICVGQSVERTTESYRPRIWEISAHRRNSPARSQTSSSSTIPQALGSPMSDQKTETLEACLDVLDRFMAALNAHDAQGLDATMHVPHVRLA